MPPHETLARKGAIRGKRGCMAIKMSRDREYEQIRKFVAACRRQWPGAKIVLWPNDGASIGAEAPINPNTHLKENDHEHRHLSR
jgi:hypothetical protein